MMPTDGARFAVTGSTRTFWAPSPGNVTLVTRPQW